MNNKIGICKLFPIHEKYYLINNKCFVVRTNDTMCGEEGKNYVRKYKQK
jgi:hypothetical protein